jgi:hypothetical protein
MYVYICMICVGVCIHQHNVYVYICMYGTCRNLLTLTLTSLGRRDDAVAGQSAPWPGHALSYSTGDDPVYDYIRPYPDNNYTIISYIMLYFTRLFHCTHSATTYYVITQSNPQSYSDIHKFKSVSEKHIHSLFHKPAYTASIGAGLNYTWHSSYSTADCDPWNSCAV